MISSNPPLVDFVQEGLRTRRETLTEVVTGKKGLIERRLEIVDRRQSMFLETDSGTQNKTAEIQLNEEPKNDESNQGSSGVDPSQNVEIRVDSPADEEIRAANNLSEDYPDAKRIELSDHLIKIHKPNGNISSVKVGRMTQESENEPATSEASTPTMSSAAPSQ